jgi:hypothetical protein
MNNQFGLTDFHWLSGLAPTSRSAGCHEVRQLNGVITPLGIVDVGDIFTFSHRR